MLRNIVTRAELLRVPLPEATASYSPVPHAIILDELSEMLYKRSLNITNETFRADAQGNKMTGMFRVDQGNSEMGFMVAFKNSYDKSISVGFAAGAQVFICENGAVSGEITMMRRHTGSVVSELVDKINYTIDHMEESFNSILRDSNRMKEIELTDNSIAELVGKMFMNEDLITSAQLSIIKQQFNKSSFEEFLDKNAWSFYNWCTLALKESHSSTMIQDHINLHRFFNANILK